MKKADNIFVRAKAYVKEHPRTSFQDAIQKVKGKKVSGSKVKSARPASRKAAVSAAIKVPRKRISGVKKVTVTKVTPKSDKNSQLLKLGKVILGRIDRKEEELKNTKDKEARRLLIGFINGEHKKLDAVYAQMKK